LCAFFVTLEGSNPEHHSGNAEHSATSHECHHANDKAPIEGAYGLASLGQSPEYRTDHPKEGASGYKHGGWARKSP
jgi:hypothetical protein